MAKAKSAPVEAAYDAEARVHLILPAAQAAKLKGLGVGETVTLDVKGVVHTLVLNEHDSTLGLTVESCEIAQERSMTMSDALDKSSRKRRGYEA